MLLLHLDNLYRQVGYLPPKVISSVVCGGRGVKCVRQCVAERSTEKV
jgi:hypothetical protein